MRYSAFKTSQQAQAAKDEGLLEKLYHLYLKSYLIKEISSFTTTYKTVWIGKQLVSMKFLKDPRKILRYVYDEAIGRFLGFIIAFSASGLVSKFFETRSFRNLWGITAKKKVISKEAFENYEWIASVVIGFLVLELYNKYLKESIDRYVSIGYKKASENLKPYIPVVQSKTKEIQQKALSTFSLKMHLFILQMRKLIANYSK